MLKTDISRNQQIDRIPTVTVGQLFLRNVFSWILNDEDGSISAISLKMHYFYFAPFSTNMSAIQNFVLIYFKYLSRFFLSFSPWTNLSKVRLSKYRLVMLSCWIERIWSQGELAGSWGMLFSLWWLLVRLSSFDASTPKMLRV